MTAETKPVVAGLYIDSGPRQLLDLQPASEVSRRECCHEVAARVLGSITIDRLTEEELLPNTCGMTGQKISTTWPSSMTKPE